MEVLIKYPVSQKRERGIFILISTPHGVYANFDDTSQKEDP